MTKRGHSPDYPMIGLKEAVERCRRLFSHSQGHAVGREDIAKGMGYNSMHGQAMSGIAAMRKFGLLSKKGDLLQITDLAKKILFPTTKEEGELALAEAALLPPLFNELYKEYGTNLPQESVLTNRLVRQGFLVDAAKRALDAYQETLPYVMNTTLVASPSEDYPEDDPRVAEEDTGGNMGMTLHPGERTNPSPTPARPVEQTRSSGLVARQSVVDPNTHSERKVFDYNFDSDGGVGIVLRGDVDTEDALEVVASWLDMKRKELAKKARSATNAAHVRPRESSED